MNQPTRAPNPLFFSDPPKLVDPAGRVIDYLRLAITDRCNLRCNYCMPGEDVQFLETGDRLTLDELKFTCKIMADLGVEKIRLTGGEPFTHPDMMELMAYLHGLESVTSLHITTNGILAAAHIPELAKMGLAGLNLSLDSLNRDNFKRITRRDKFEAVWQTLEAALRYNVPLKINTVILDDLNTHEISDFVALAKKYPIDLRFIEQMPFSGRGEVFRGEWSVNRIIAEIERAHPGFSEKQPAVRHGAHF